MLYYFKYKNSDYKKSNKYFVLKKVINLERKNKMKTNKNAQTLGTLHTHTHTGNLKNNKKINEQADLYLYRSICLILV